MKISSARFFTLSLPLVFVFAMLIMPSLHGEAGEVKELPLGARALPNPELLLTVSDVNMRSSVYPFSLISGMVRPRKGLSSKDGWQAKLKIAGENLEVELKDKTLVLKREGEEISSVDFDMRSRSAKGAFTYKKADGTDYAISVPFFSCYTRNKKKMCYGNYRSAWIKGNKLGNNIVVLYDNNMDGAFEPLKDTYACDTTRIFAPLGDYIAGNDLLLKVEGLGEGSSKLLYTPYAGPSAKVGLNISSNGSYQYFCAFAHETEKFSFVISNTGKPVTILPGKYKLLYGYVTKGGRAILSIIPNTYSFEVAEGAEQVLTLGAPFSAHIRVTQKGDKVSLLGGANLQMEGGAGEVYGGLDFDYNSKPVVYALSMEDKTTKKLGQIEFG